MRKRFRKDEREAFQPGVKVEWRNGSHWHPGTVTSVPDTDRDGWGRVMLTNHAQTRTVLTGDVITGTPGSVRLPQIPDVAPAGAPTALCPPCGREWLAWLDYKPVPPIALISIGNARAHRDALDGRARDRRNLIRSQQELITRVCADKHRDDVKHSA